MPTIASGCRVRHHLVRVTRPSSGAASDFATAISAFTRSATITVTRLSAGCSDRSPVTVGVWHRMPRRCHSGGVTEGAELQADVLVVGAGPSGLMAAVCLARLGVDAVIVDGKDGPTRESRALAVQARTMELYDQLGLVDRVLVERSPATTLVPGAGRRSFGRIELRAMAEGVTPYRELTVFEQSRNERMLVDALADLGREVRWGHRLARLETMQGSGGDAASVVATLDTPDGVGHRARPLLHRRRRSALARARGARGALRGRDERAHLLRGRCGGRDGPRRRRDQHADHGRALPARLPDGPGPDAPARRGPRPRPRRGRGTPGGRRCAR